MPLADDPIVVIGAGAGGLPAATALVESGRHVVLVDRGHHTDVARIPTDRYNYEVRDVPWLTGDNEWKGDVSLVRALGVGGSTLHFQAVSHRPPSGFLRAWGLNKSIDAVFDEIEVFLGVAGVVQPVHKLNPVSQHALKAARDLGWNAQEAPVAILSRPRDGRPNCNYCGLCFHGCRPGDKSSANVTWWPRAHKTGRLKLIENTTVSRLQHDGKGQVTAIHLNGRDGSASTLDVSAVVVAAGAVETPRLLLSSGLGNRQVGRNLTGTLWQSLVTAMPPPLSGGHAGIPVDIHINEFEGEGLLLAQGRNLGSITGPVLAARYYATPKAGPGLRRWMRDTYPRLSVLCGYAESTTDINDGIDIKARRIDKALRSADHAKIRRLSTLLRTWAGRARATPLREFGSLNYNVSGSMLRGTCRMGPGDEGACHPDGLLRGTRNVHVADASLIGRGLITNPSLTLQVLGLQIGRSLARKDLS